MNTALNDLLKIINSMIYNGGDSDLLAVKSHCESLIEKEKQQIIDAYNAGEYDGYQTAKYSEFYKYESADIYYEKLFNKY